MVNPVTDFGVRAINIFNSVPSADYAHNTTYFNNLEAAHQGKIIDLGGKRYPIDRPRIKNRYINGFWVVNDFDGDAVIDIPVEQTLSGYVHKHEGGKTTIGWPQDTSGSYDRLMSQCGYMAANGHSPGSKDWTTITSVDQWKSVIRSQKHNFSSGEDEVFASTIVPRSSDSGNYSGPTQFAIVKHPNSGLMTLRRRNLAWYSPINAGGLSQAESPWKEVKLGGVTLGAAIRSKVGAGTSGLPTLGHSLSLYGGDNGSKAYMWFGFHGLPGAGGGPFLGYIVNGKIDSSYLSYATRIGGLTSGVEPTVAWYKNGGSSRLCGFVRSQSTSYPIRFWSTAVAGLGANQIESAVVQSYPYDNSFATYSPIPCRMRPKARGTVSGYIPTWENLPGWPSDELHFAFSGNRIRNGNAGMVPIYWGRITRGSGNFNDIWKRAQIVFIGYAYFANSNINDTSNQVGVPSIEFTDASTLHVFYNTMRPAITGDYDEACLMIKTIKLRDEYPYNTDEVPYDDGSTWPVFSQNAAEYVEY